MAYKVFQNGYPLPASDLNNYLMNQSVIVFADSSARSSTISSPVEGMVTYLESDQQLYVFDGSSWVNINDNTAAIPKSTVTTAGDLIVADGNASVTRLGIGASQGLLYVNGSTPGWLAKGSDGQVLSVSSGNLVWANNAASGGKTQLATTSLTGSSISFTSISQSYKDLEIVVRNFLPDTDAQLLMTLNNVTSSAYQSRTSDDSSASFTWSSSSLQLSQSNDSGAGDGLFKISIPDYTNSTTWKMGDTLSLVNNSTTNTSGSYQVRRWATNQTSAISRIDLLPSAGSFTSGTAILYGVS